MSKTTQILGAVASVVMLAIALTAPSLAAGNNAPGQDSGEARPAVSTTF